MITLTRSQTPTYADLLVLNERLKVELTKALAASTVLQCGEIRTRAKIAIDYGRHTAQTSTYPSPLPAAP